MGMVNHYPLSEGTEGSTNLGVNDPTSDRQQGNKSLPLNVLKHGGRMNLQHDVETTNVDIRRYSDLTSQHKMTSTGPNLLPKSVGSRHGFSMSNGARLMPSNEPNGPYDIEDVSIGESKDIIVDAAGSSSQSSDQRIGRWTLDEKVLFLYGLQKFGKGRWKKISLYVPGRSLVQIKSHAQKVMKRMDAGENVFNRLEENGACVHALVTRLHEDIGLDPIPAKYSPNVLPSPENVSSVPKKSTTRKGKRKRQDGQLNEMTIGNSVRSSIKHPLGGIEQILAASALCQLSYPGNNDADAPNNMTMTTESVTMHNYKT